MIHATKDWFCENTKGTLQVENFDEEKHQFLFDVKVIIAIEEIPSCLVLNWDQIPYSAKF